MQRRPRSTAATSRPIAVQAGERGAKANAIGLSRGGRTTKIHALVDILGRPLRLILTPGNTSDVKAADQLIGDTAGMKRLIVDRGYDPNSIRTALRQQNTIPVIPGRKNRKRTIRYDETRYKERWRIEATFCRLKDFRRVATRYDKFARIYRSAVMIAATVAFWLWLRCCNGACAVRCSSVIAFCPVSYGSSRIYF